MADLLYNAVLEKLTGEQFDEDFDFTGIIPASNTVTYRTVTATKMDGTDATEAVVLASSMATDVVTVTLDTGSEETAYVIKVAVRSSSDTPAVMTKLLNVSSPGVYR